MNKDLKDSKYSLSPNIYYDTKELSGKNKKKSYWDNVLSKSID